MPVRLFLRDPVFDDGCYGPVDLLVDRMKLLLELAAPTARAGVSPAALVVIGSDKHRNRLFFCW